MALVETCVEALPVQQRPLMLPLALSLFAISLLAVFKAPIKFLWYVALGATDWGHFMAFICIGLVLLAIRSGKHFGSVFWVSLAAAILYLTPLARAFSVSRHFPRELTSRFGNSVPREDIDAPSRQTPLDLADLFKGVHSPAIQKSSVIYTTYHGEDLSLDLYQPKHSDQSLPGVIIVHSGSWQSG